MKAMVSTSPGLRSARRACLPRCVGSGRHCCVLSVHFLRDDLHPAALCQQVEDLREHDCRRARDDEGVLGSDLAESFDEVIFRVPVQVLLDSPGGARCDLSVNVPRIDRADAACRHICLPISIELPATNEAFAMLTRE